MPSDETVRVIVRFRPLNEREKALTARLGEQGDPLRIVCEESGAVAIFLRNEPQAAHRFALDRAFASDSSQAQLYSEFQATVEDVLNGFNGTIFAYGQTGSGKTFSMFGPDVRNENLCGIIPRTASQIFDHISRDTSGTEYVIRCSFLEIYRETIRDLLAPKNTDLKIRESRLQGVYVEGLTQECVTCSEDVLSLIAIGERYRSVAATQMNQHSSRSHSLLQIVIHQKETGGASKVGTLNLADLAGSEKIEKTGAVGQTLEEAKKINQSLSALGNCIHALTEKGRSHIPYRDSKLTFILRESLGGNSKTTLLVACSPHADNLEESISTLRFAVRAKTIQQHAVVNKQLSREALNRLVQELKGEIGDLKAAIKKKELLVNEKLRAKGVHTPLEALGDYEPLADSKSSLDPTALAETRLELERAQEEKTDQAERFQDLLSQAADELEAMWKQEHVLEKELDAVQTEFSIAEKDVEALQIECGQLEQLCKYSDLIHLATLEELHAELTLENSLRDAAAKAVEQASFVESATKDVIAARIKIEKESAVLQELKRTLDVGLRDVAEQTTALDDKFVVTSKRVQQLLTEAQHRIAEKRDLAEATESVERDCSRLEREMTEVKAEQSRLQFGHRNVAHVKCVSRGGVPPSMSSYVEPDRQGFLRMQGVMWTWYRYWFLLKRQHLFFLKSPEDNAPLGVIPLAGARVKHSREDGVLQFTILQKDGASNTLMAETLANFDEWMRMVELASATNSEAGSLANGAVLRGLGGSVILCSGVAADSLYAGTSTGLVYRATFSFDQQSQMTPVIEDVSSVSLSSDPIFAMHIQTPGPFMLALHGSTLSVLSVAPLALVAVAKQEQSITACSWDYEDDDEMQPCFVLSCGVSLRFFKLFSQSSIQRYNTIPLSGCTAVHDLLWVGRSGVFVATNRAYVHLNILTGKSTDIMTLSADLSPKLVRLDTSRVALLGGSNSIVICACNGDVIFLSKPLCWCERPLAIVPMAFPDGRLIALEGNSLELFDANSGTFRVETRPPEARCLSADGARLYLFSSTPSASTVQVVPLQYIMEHSAERTSMDEKAPQMHHPSQPMPKSQWVPDHAASECMTCGLVFSLFRRKHHCRHCGRVVCDECSRSRARMGDNLQPRRVCDRCSVLFTDAIVAPAASASNA